MALPRVLRVALLLACGIALAACARSTREATGTFVERAITVGGERQRYQVFVPARRGRAASPVIVFLHGSGERGSDNQAQVRVGIGAYVRRHMADFPAIVVFPQAPENTEWNQNADMVFAQLDAATREFGGDTRRTYLSGLSMGGFGTWDFALRAPTRFAALVPVCGGLVAPGRPSMSVAGVAGDADPYADVARRLKDVPAWIFHGAKDDLVPPDYSRRMHAALQAAAAKDVRYTEFPEANHNSWDPAYLETPELWTWLFAQRRP